MTTEKTSTRAPIDDIRAALEKMGGQFKAVLPTQQHVDRFIRVVMTAVQGNPDLLAADRASLYSACMKCAQDGLLPDGKQAVLKIYNTKVGENQWAKMAQYEPMTDGLLIKLRNSGEIVGTPKVHPVYEADDFDYQLGDDEKIIHKPAALGKARGNLIGAYSIVKLKSGDVSREVMSIVEIDGIMARTKSQKDGVIFGPWKTDKPEMCRKTVFKRHCKRLPRSTDLDNVIKYDNETNGIDLDTAPARPAQAALPAPGQAGGEPVPEKRSGALDEVVRQGGVEKPKEPAAAAADGQARDIL